MNIQLTDSQQRVFLEVCNFLENGSDIFVLRGYAGTGKTTLIKFITHYLDSKKLSHSLLAPTGRASKVLRDKIGDGMTIHRAIYSLKIHFKEVDNTDVSKKSYKYHFPLKQPGSACHTLIVDECSMISDVKNEQELLSFGSGRLLSDLLQFVKLNNVKKVIFVGDSAQLPPVSDAQSKVFDMEYLNEKGFAVETTEMTEVLRQKNGTEILNVATHIRELLSKPQKDRQQFVIEPNGRDIFQLKYAEIAQAYIDIYPMPEVGNGVVISYSNKQCYDLNAMIRTKLYGQSVDVQIGDILIINNNNYNSYGFEIYNGDMAKVVGVGDTVSRKVPVSIDKEKRNVLLTFRNIDLYFAEYGKRISCNIVENLLVSENRDLTIWEQKALYIDFRIRCNLKEGSEQYADALKSDPYFNALRVKYGYAITCHKSQGGEWEKVFVNYDKRCALNNDALRWCYTATTRAKSSLYLINPPRITPFTKLQWSAIAKLSKPPKDFFQDQTDIATPYHNNAPMGVRLKYWGMIEALKDSPFEIEKIECFNYLDRYSFKYNETELMTLDVHYDGAGIYKLLPVSDANTPKDSLNDVWNKALAIPTLNYAPTTDAFNGLYQRMINACDELDICITNVIECVDNHYILYYLKTDARFAVIQFYFTANGQFTTAMPKSELGNEDKKLNNLISIID